MMNDDDASPPLLVVLFYAIAMPRWNPPSQDAFFRFALKNQQEFSIRRKKKKEEKEYSFLTKVVRSRSNQIPSPAFAPV